MKGTIVKKGKRYYVATHHRGIDGKRKQASHGGYATKAEAERALRQVLAQLDQGSFVAASRLVLGAFLEEQWLPSKRASVRPSTADSYASCIRLHVTPRIGSVPLQRLVASDLNKLYSDLLSDGRLNGSAPGLSARTVRYIHTILRRALADALRWGVVSRNVADLADPPKPSARSSEMTTWSAGEVRQFLESIGQHPWYPLFVIAVATGMRRGELLGLRWADVSLENERLCVRQQLTSLHDVLTDPKTSRSRRTTDLDPETVRILRRHRANQAEQRLRWGQAYSDHDLVFCREDGSPMHPDRLTVLFQNLVKRSGSPKIRLHDLRHTNATLALEAGVPAKVISDRLGHATVAFTMDVYAHAVPALQAEAARRVGSLIFGDGGH